MNRRPLAIVAILLLFLLGLALAYFAGGGAARDVAPPAADLDATGTPAAATGALAGTGTAGEAAADVATGGRVELATASQTTGVRGIVVDAQTGRPVAGVEVLAVRELPSVQPLVDRFRGLFHDGMFVETRRPPQVLGRTTSLGDGTFEIRGLPPGRVFLDGRSDAHRVRTPATARLALGEIAGGIELRTSPAGRVRGIVLGVDGGPVAGAAVSLRPGLNAFLGQLTERNYRWLEATTAADGTFDLPGVPTGNGYVLSASSPTIALEERFGVEVREGQVTDVTLRGRPGATVRGRVVDGDGQPVAGANVAMVYLDLTRVLFSADGRAEPLATDAAGRFEVRPIAAGRVAFVAVADGKAPSPIRELAVVDDGVYEDVELQLGGGSTVRGIVVDDQDRPVAGATVELRPFEQPDGPQFLQLMLKIRRVEVASGDDGRFVANGLTGDRLVVQAGKPGYTTVVRFGVKLDEPEVRLQVLRGATVRGRVQLADGAPVTRFRVEARPAGRGERGAAEAAADPGAGDEGAVDAGAPAADDERDGDERGGGFRMRFGRGDGGGRGPGDMRRPRTVQLAEGQTLGDRTMDGAWQEIAAADGTFALQGIPPGTLRVRVRADGHLDAQAQTIDLAAGQESEVLQFTLAPGLAVTGTVVDDATGQPVSDAQVTAYRQRDGRRGRGLLQFDVDGEDFDFLALSAAQGRRSDVTDSKGAFRIDGLGDGSWRFTARHPDMAKASAKDVVLRADAPAPVVEIRVDAGGCIEGGVTGFGGRPLADAVIAAFSLQTGTLRSDSTDRGGAYRIDGLPPGQYVVFKSRLDERADNIPLELMSNMRLKTTTVRQGRVSRLDIHDDSEDGVRVFGVVRENGAPVPRALVTLLGSDRDGLLGMGVRAGAADAAGRYELVGIRPGSYVAQVSRFTDGRPMQTSLAIEVPEGGREFAFDVDLPSSSVAGRVLDSRGAPVAGVEVSLGSEDSSLAGVDGLIGLVAQGGLAQARTDADGVFRLRSVAAGTYTLRVQARGRRARDGDRAATGSATLPGVVVDGRSEVAGLLVTVPLAGRIEGVVVDGSGSPVAGAQIHYAETGVPRRAPRNALADLFGMQRQPIVSGEDGRFRVDGLNPGTYDLRVDTEALQAGKASDVQVPEDGAADVTLRIVRGATLQVRATNVDRQQIPLAYVTLLDGKGKKVVNRVSTLSVMKRLMQNRDEVADTGWYEFGSVPPDTYTLVVAEPGQPELRIERAIADGETVRWEIDVEAELKARAKAR